MYRIFQTFSSVQVGQAYLSSRPCLIMILVQCCASYGWVFVAQLLFQNFFYLTQLWTLFDRIWAHFPLGQCTIILQDQKVLILSWVGSRNLSLGLGLFLPYGELSRLGNRPHILFRKNGQNDSSCDCNNHLASFLGDYQGLGVELAFFALVQIHYIRYYSI